MLVFNCYIRPSDVLQFVIGTSTKRFNRTAPALLVGTRRASRAGGRLTVTFGVIIPSTRRQSHRSGVR